MKNKQAKNHLAILSGSIVLLVGTLIWLIVHFYLQNYIHDQAVHSVTEAAAYYSTDREDRQTPHLYATLLQFDEDRKLIDSPATVVQGMPISLEAQSIARWVTQDAQVDRVHQVSLDGQEYYALLVPLLRGDGYLLSYVNVTPERRLLQTVSFTLIVVILFCLILSGLYGIRVGRELEHQQERQKQFFENASHELKTPLMVIQGYADAMKSEVLHDAQKTSGLIMKETEKMTVLVNQILQLSRIESGEFTFKMSDISLEDLCENSLYSIAFVARQQGIAVNVMTEDAIVTGDGFYLAQALNNLLTNALRHAQSVIDIQADRTGIRIYNDGGSLSKDDLKHMFDRFYSGVRGSTGIGMALTKEIIERHRWRIHASNVRDGVLIEIIF